jgi:hypothetical protein
MSTSKRKKEQREAELKKQCAQRKLERRLRIPRTVKKKGFEPLVSSQAFRRDTVNYPSFDKGSSNTDKKENDYYSGSYLIGITVVHKSCLAPVSIETDPGEFARMRR